MKEKLSYRLKKVKKQLAITRHHLEEVEENIRWVNELAILYIKSQKDYKMPDKKWSEFKNHNGDSVIEFDDVMNNVNMIAKEYDITVDQKTGKVWLAGNAKESECIIQGIIAGYMAKNDKVPGASFIYTDICQEHRNEKENDIYKPAMFTGSIFFEDLPVLVFGPTTKEEAKATIIETKKPQIEEVEFKEVIDIKIPNFDTLRHIKKGHLKPPRGLSRTTRKTWNNALREKYPEAFDRSGNFMGFNIPDEAKELDIPTLRKEYPNAFDKNGSFIGFKTPDDVKNHKKSEVPEVSKSPVTEKSNVVIEPGAGNLMTNMADARIPDKFFIGKLFSGRGYAVVSTYSKDGLFDNAAWIIFNKEKTAQFVLDGLASNQGFAKLVAGSEVYSIKMLKSSYLSKDDILVYFVSNGVTALQALGTAEADIDIIKHRIK